MATEAEKAKEIAKAQLRILNARVAKAHQRVLDEEKKIADRKAGKGK